jgi:MFS family permease
MKSKSFFKGIRINRVIQFLTYSDVLMLSGWGLVNPILAIFFNNQIKGGSASLAGLAVAVYLVTKSVLQMPIARYIDLEKGEGDDFWAMVIGSLMISMTAFLYTLAKLPVHVILIQIFYGVGSALSYPAWMAIFTRHTDRNQEGIQWSLYYTATDLSAALTAGLGGFLVTKIGYNNLFVIVGITSLIGTAFLAGIARRLKRS